ncbi:hypothetical protein SAMN04487751_1932 [Microbacterium saccharophilum]|uniref:Uncharacterized protein n=1 Tax=Microbacterium saccharophilum TaxID=1213358 RepID=A0A7Z7CXT3_9MICO|nr:hypothetical protein SAMN04487751_1932 [Microbacterium saccharophilum]
MMITILLVAVAAVGLVGTVRALATDGYRAVPTDPSRLP